MTLGEKLRQAREERGITISDVAEHTRISPLYLQSIEADDFKVLPGGIFNKGFIKSFAKYVGVDENEAMTDYAKQFSQQNEDDGDEPKTYRPEVLTDDRSSGSMLPTIIFAVIILGLMTWGVLTLVNYIQNQPSQPAANTNTNSANVNIANANTANVNTADPIPATDEIKVELKTQKNPVSVSFREDGKAGSKLMTTETPLNLEGKENVRFGFAKTLSKDIQMTLNGKQITLPDVPQNPTRKTIEVEITKDNIKQILTDGEYKYGETRTP